MMGLCLSLLLMQLREILCKPKKRNMNFKKSKSLIGILLEKLLATQGMSVKELCGQLHLSSRTYSRLKKTTMNL